jgi:hypothetical protein
MSTPIEIRVKGGGGSHLGTIATLAVVGIGAYIVLSILNVFNLGQWVQTAIANQERHIAQVGNIARQYQTGAISSTTADAELIEAQFGGTQNLTSGQITRIQNVAAQLASSVGGQSLINLVIGTPSTTHPQSSSVTTSGVPFVTPYISPAQITSSLAQMQAMSAGQTIVGKIITGGYTKVAVM